MPIDSHRGELREAWVRSKCGEQEKAVADAAKALEAVKQSAGDYPAYKFVERAKKAVAKVVEAQRTLDKARDASGAEFDQAYDGAPRAGS